MNPPHGLNNDAKVAFANLFLIKMKISLFYKTFIFLILLLAFFAAPILQLISNESLLYLNGDDEYSYLNFEFAKNTLGATRISNGVVILGHNLGFGGGAINLILDLFSVISISIIIFYTLDKLINDVPINKKIFSLLMIMGLPLAFGGSNPLQWHLVEFINNTDFLAYFIVTSNSIYPSMLRSPESQLSLVVISLFSLIILTKRWGLLLIILIPFCYFFVGIYFATVLTIYYTLLLIEKFLGKVDGIVLVIACGVLFAGISFALWLGVYFFLDNNMVLHSHDPVFGVNLLCMLGLIFILNFIYDWNSLNQEIKKLVVALCVGSIMIYNFNVLNGLVLQPQHFELEVPIAIGLVVVLYYLYAVPRKPLIVAVFNNSLVLIVFLASLSFASKSIKSNMELYSRVDKLMSNPDFIDSILNNPKGTFINDPYLSSKISGLMYPEQKMLLSSVEPAFIGNDDYYHALVNLRVNLKRLRPDDYSDFYNSLNYLIDRHEDRYQNWQKFSTLRRGFLLSRSIKIKPSSDFDGAEFKLFKVN